MRTGIAISGTLHAAAIAATVLGLPLLDPEPVNDQPLLVDLVTIADETTSQPQPEAKVEETPPAPPKKAEADPPKPPEPAPKPEPKPQAVEKSEPAASPERKPLVAPPAPDPDPVAAKPAEPLPPKAEPEPEPKPEPVPVAKPEPEKPEPVPAEEPVQLAAKPPEPEVKPEPKPEKPAPNPFADAPTPKLKPKPQAKPEPKPEPEPKRPEFDASRIAALLDKSQKKEQKPLLERLAAKVADSEPQKPTPPSRIHDQALTMSEIDAIRYQIEKCWSVPAGARDAEELVVKIRVFLNPDGSLSQAPEIVESAQQGDSFYRTAAESARRAVQLCAPLKHLPPDKYQRWRELTLTFNPRQMLGG